MKIVLFIFILLSFSECTQKEKILINRDIQMMFADSSRLDRPFAKDPHVIRFKDQFIMYYSVPGYKDKNNTVHGWGIGIAGSNDLKTWEKIGEVNIDKSATYEANGYAAPCALVIDNKVHLFYQTYGNGKNDAICHAWSTDGIHFTRNETNPIFRPDGDWNCGRAIDAEVVLFKGNFYLYYATRDPEFKIQMMGVAVASGNSNFNRENWENISFKGPVLKPELPWELDCVEAASVIEKDEALYMFYAGGYNNAPQQVGVAKSTDGIHWERIFEEPFFSNGKTGEWNSSESGHPHIFESPEGSDWLFYQGNNDNGNTWYISNVEIIWENNIPNII
jgi:beta-1,2-mannobiose phosphorylase / 1,2-beta-oligomannan phosphorylase